MLDCGVSIQSLLDYFPVHAINCVESISPRQVNDLKASKTSGFMRDPLRLKLPEFALYDIHTVDLLLVSNQHTLLGLPYLTEHLGFDGLILATEPTAETGKQLCEELIRMSSFFPLGQVRAGYDASKSTKMSRIDRIISVRTTQKVTQTSFREMYSIENLKSSIGKVRRLSYNEKVVMPSSYISFCRG